MKIIKISGKTWRDKKDTVILYHASPEKLSRILPRSSFKGVAGSYFSPSYSSIAKDWASWVARKKLGKHSLIKQWNNLWEKENKLEDIKEPSQEQVQELIDIRNKLEKLRPSYENLYKEHNKPYSFVYVHKVACPRDIFEKYNTRMQNQLQNEFESNVGFWLWGEQIFIDEKDLPRLKILKAEKWDKNEVYEKENNEWKDRSRATPEKWPETDPDMTVPKAGSWYNNSKDKETE
jgi:hypothetical protein